MHRLHGIPRTARLMAGKVGRRVYRTARWKAIRLRIFARDGWRCFKCGRRSALECDHVRPITKGGDWFDPGNLRTVCRTCHLAITAEHNRGDLPEPRAELRAMALGGR